MTTAITSCILTRAEAAEALRISDRFLDAQIKAGNIQVVRHGRLIRVHRDEVDRVSREGLPRLSR